MCSIVFKMKISGKDFNLIVLDILNTILKYTGEVSKQDHNRYSNIIKRIVKKEYGIILEEQKEAINYNCFKIGYEKK